MKCFMGSDWLCVGNVEQSRSDGGGFLHLLLSFEWNSIRLSDPAHGIVTKTVHKTLPGGGGGHRGRGGGGGGCGVRGVGGGRGWGCGG